MRPFSGLVFMTDAAGRKPEPRRFGYRIATRRAGASVR